MAVSATPDDENLNPLPRPPPTKGSVGVGVRRKMYFHGSVDWFYGFKLHLVVNDRGELLASKITAGNVDDRNSVLELARALSGKLFGDRGYISQKLFEQLWERRVQLITKLRKNMKNMLLPLLAPPAVVL